jgi:hypothetical protein
MKRGFAAQFGERLKFLSPQQATGYFGIFTTAHRAVVPHFRFKKDLILYLNSSRAASSGEFKFKKRPERWKEYVGFETYGGIKNKKGDIMCHLCRYKRSF